MASKSSNLTPSPRILRSGALPSAVALARSTSGPPICAHRIPVDLSDSHPRPLFQSCADQGKSDPVRGQPYAKGSQPGRRTPCFPRAIRPAGGTRGNEAPSSPTARCAGDSIRCRTERPRSREEGQGILAGYPAVSAPTARPSPRSRPAPGGRSSRPGAATPACRRSRGRDSRRSCFHIRSSRSWLDRCARSDNG